MSAPTTQDLVERALAASSSDGCIVIAHESSDVNLRFAGNTLTTNGETRDRGVTVVATVSGPRGVSTGSVTRTNVGTDQVADLVAAAEQAARASEPADDPRPLVEPGEGNAAGWDLPPDVTTSATLASFAGGLGEVFLQARAQGRELFGFAEHELTTTYLGTSSGVRLRHAQPTGRLEVTGKSHERTRSTYVGQTTRDFRDVDMRAIDAELVRRLGWQARRVDVAPGRHPTIVPPSAVADLMTVVYWAASAREAYDGRTVFSRAGGGTRVGEELSPLPVELSSDPHDPALPSQPFVTAASSGPSSSVFDNGLPLHATAWVDAGRLAALLQTRASADLTGLPVTPAIDGLRMSLPGATGTVDDLVAATSERALLLTCLWYIREVDPRTLLVTGLTRDGVHVVEGGEVVGTATNFRFNESPVDMLRRISAATATGPCLPREWADYFTRTTMPALLVDGFNMSTVSPAS